MLHFVNKANRELRTMFVYLTLRGCVYTAALQQCPISWYTMLCYTPLIAKFAMSGVSEISRRCALEVPAYTVETRVPLSWGSQVPELENPSMKTVGYDRQAIRFPW